MTTVQLARLRARRRNAAFNRLRFSDFLEDEPEPVRLPPPLPPAPLTHSVTHSLTHSLTHCLQLITGQEPLPSHAGSTRDAQGRPVVAWSNTARIERQRDREIGAQRDRETPGGASDDSPNEVRRAEDPTWYPLLPSRALALRRCTGHAAVQPLPCTRLLCLFLSVSGRREYRPPEISIGPSDNEDAASETHGQGGAKVCVVM